MMPSVMLKRAEKKLEDMREKQGLPPGAAEMVEDLIASIRAVERRVAMLEGKENPLLVQDRD